MIADFLETILIASYAIPAVVLMLFGLNLYVMLYMFLRRRPASRNETERLMAEFRARFTEADLPAVVTQIPIYNEYNVAERAMRAVAAMSYPTGRHTRSLRFESDPARWYREMCGRRYGAVMPTLDERALPGPYAWRMLPSSWRVTEQFTGSPFV